jgi:ribonuclease BN (tRNA processing enzyme)
MKLTFLGTGSLKTIGRRNPAGILLEADKKLILLDCGSGTLTRMAEKDIDFMKLYGVFVTHGHIDHLNDIVSIVGSMMGIVHDHVEKNRKEKLIIRGSKDTLAVYKILRATIPVPDKFEIDLKIIKNEEKIGSLVVKSILVDHFAQLKKPCYALRFNLGGKSIVYSGDIDWSENINKFIEFSKEANVLIIDGGKSIGKGEGPHLEPFQISQIAYQANPKKVICVHLTDIDAPAKIKDAVSEFYKGEVIVARDGMEMEV